MANWKQPCSEKHLRVISQDIAQWQDFAPFLDLTEADEIDIVEAHPRSVPAQRLAMLRKWLQKLGAKAATYEKLAEVFRSCSRQDLVDKISELLAEDSGSLTTEAGVLYKIFFNVYSTSL